MMKDVQSAVLPAVVDIKRPTLMVLFFYLFLDYVWLSQGENSLWQRQLPSVLAINTTSKRIQTICPQLVSEITSPGRGVPGTQTLISCARDSCVRAIIDEWTCFHQIDVLMITFFLYF